jgi:UDP-N-acetylglucosamine 2-epimerase (non-hydrolysing)
MKNKKLCFIFGTRPEIIKLSPLIKLCLNKRLSFFSIHSGQHYSFAMDRLFFRELGLPQPEYQLKVRSSAPFKQGEHTGRMLIEIERVLLKELPYCALVQGDTNTVLAGALTAEKISTTESYTGLQIKLAHVEAGLRSFDRSMPEETNRFIADHLADFLFAPTAEEKKLLLREGVPQEKVFISGNTIVDALEEYSSVAKRKSRIKKVLGLENNTFMLLTLHRQENVDAREIFSSILQGLKEVYTKFRLPIIFPVHPRTAKMLARLNLALPKGIIAVKPLGFLDFLWLEAHASLVLTDSGGVQEEACILKVPCVTLRRNTERPQTLAAGANLLAGNKPEAILRSAAKMLKVKRNWQNPFGDGRSAQHILEIILSR